MCRLAGWAVGLWGGLVGCGVTVGLVWEECWGSVQGCAE